MDISQLKKLREVEEENHRLKRMFADMSLDHQMLSHKKSLPTKR
jgi:putative transposase